MDEHGTKRFISGEQGNGYLHWEGLRFHIVVLINKMTIFFQPFYQRLLCSLLISNLIYYN